VRPELLAVRAVNQYRCRDILAYLGLRYYLNNDYAKKDIWARDISTYLVKTREAPVYFCSCHFKEMAENNVDVIYRNIYLPGPNEVLAEAALLYDCSSEPTFQSLQCVYSYRFPELSSKEGVFKAYFPGYQERNASIAKVCSNLGGTDKVVRYTDIKKFYLSITHELALQSWREACEPSNLSTSFRELGEQLLTQYNETSTTNNEGRGLLTGPMLSHLIANLVLVKVDKLMFQNMKGKYWRYVDDFVLVGDSNQVESGRRLLNSVLSDMGFSLHDERKDFEVESNVWLQSLTDFDASKSKIWTSLVVNIKRFLITKPEKRSVLQNAFSDAGINIPVVDYSSVVAEIPYREKFFNWLIKYSWAPNSLRSLTVDKLVRDALQVRKAYCQEINNLLDQGSNIRGYARKQLISKLRFLAMRLSYLATSDTLSSLSTALMDYPELYLQSRVMESIRSRDVSLLIKFGSNAVQAAAQILRIKNDVVRCSLSSFGEVELQGLAILRLNGLKIEFLDNIEEQHISDPLNQFALGINSKELMKSSQLFIRELACLRGIDSELKLKSILDSAFDTDEQLSFDIINQLQASSYF
jgi:hypothetical protein